MAQSPSTRLDLQQPLQQQPSGGKAKMMIINSWSDKEKSRQLASQVDDDEEEEDEDEEQEDLSSLVSSNESQDISQLVKQLPTAARDCISSSSPSSTSSASQSFIRINCVSRQASDPLQVSKDPLQVSKDKPQQLNNNEYIIDNSKKSLIPSDVSFEVQKKLTSPTTSKGPVSPPSSRLCRSFTAGRDQSSSLRVDILSKTMLSEITWDPLKWQQQQQLQQQQQQQQQEEDESEQLSQSSLSSSDRRSTQLDTSGGGVSGFSKIPRNSEIIARMQSFQGELLSECELAENELAQIRATPTSQSLRALAEDHSLSQSKQLSHSINVPVLLPLASSQLQILAELEKEKHRVQQLLLQKKQQLQSHKNILSTPSSIAKKQTSIPDSAEEANAVCVTVRKQKQQEENREDTANTQKNVDSKQSRKIKREQQQSQQPIQQQQLQHIGSFNDQTADQRLLHLERENADLKDQLRASQLPPSHVSAHIRSCESRIGELVQTVEDISICQAIQKQLNLPSIAAALQWVTIMTKSNTQEKKFIACILDMLTNCGSDKQRESPPHNADLKGAWKILKKIMEDYVDLKKKAAKFDQNTTVNHQLAMSQQLNAAVVLQQPNSDGIIINEISALLQTDNKYDSLRVLKDLVISHAHIKQQLSYYQKKLHSSQTEENLHSSLQQQQRHSHQPTEGSIRLPQDGHSGSKQFNYNSSSSSRAVTSIENSSSNQKLQTKGNLHPLQQANHPSKINVSTRGNNGGGSGQLRNIEVGYSDTPAKNNNIIISSLHTPKSSINSLGSHIRTEEKDQRIAAAAAYENFNVLSQTSLQQQTHSQTTTSGATSLKQQLQQQPQQRRSQAFLANPYLKFGQP